jgi:hypothetical protein
MRGWSNGPLVASQFIWWGNILQRTPKPPHCPHHLFIFSIYKLLIIFSFRKWKTMRRVATLLQLLAQTFLVHILE